MRAIVWCDPELKFKIFSTAYILPFLIHYFHIKYRFSLTFTVSCAPRIQKANKQTKKTVHRSFSNQGFFCVLWPSNASSPGNGFQVFVIELFLLNTQMKRPLRSLFIPHSLSHAHRLDLFLLCLSENCVKSYYPI